MWSLLKIASSELFKSCSVRQILITVVRLKTPIQARREGGAMGAPAPPPPLQTAEVHFFVKKINSKKK